MRRFATHTAPTFGVFGVDFHLLSAFFTFALEQAVNRWKSRLATKNIELFFIKGFFSEYFLNCFKRSKNRCFSFFSAAKFIIRLIWFYRMQSENTAFTSLFNECACICVFSAHTMLMLSHAFRFVCAANSANSAQFQCFVSIGFVSFQLTSTWLFHAHIHHVLFSQFSVTSVAHVKIHTHHRFIERRFRFAPFHFFEFFLSFLFHLRAK